MAVKKVLLVEDEDDIRTIGELVLRDAGGLEVVSASRATQLVELVGEHQPDVVLLDVMMPEKDGLTALKELRDTGDTTPVIFMTARIQRRETTEYVEAGAIGVISKPFDPLTLTDEINRLVDGHQNSTNKA